MITRKGRSARQRRGVGQIIAAAILMSILFSSITLYFLSIQNGQSVRSQADAQGVQYYNERLTESFTIRSLDDLGAGNRIQVYLNNTGPIPLKAVHIVVYNKTTSQILNPGATGLGSGGGVTINAGKGTIIDTGYPADSSLTYRIDILSERGNIASTTWPPPPTDVFNVNLKQISEFAAASTIASGLGALQLDFKSFGLILPSFADRDGVDQTGWKVKTENAVGYPAFRIPEGYNEYLTMRIRNVDPSGENMTLLHDSGLIVNLANDQNAQQSAAVFLCNSTQINPDVSVQAYDESDPTRAIELQNANGTSVALTARWYNLIFCDTDAIKGASNFVTNWAAQLPANSIPITPSFLVARGEFTDSHRQYGQTIPFQGITITSGTFVACLKSDPINYASCAPDQYDKYRASNATIIEDGSSVFLKPVGGTGPYTIIWLSSDGSSRIMAENTATDGNGNIELQIPSTNGTGGPVEPGFYTIQVLDINYNVYYMTFQVVAKPQNKVPLAEDDHFTIDEDAVSIFDVKSNDTDPDLDSLVVGISLPPENGTAVVNAADGSITYTPNANYFGTDMFQYTIDDKDNGIATGTVYITISSVNDAPVAFAGSIPTFDENTTRTFTLNATDVEGDPLTFALAAGGAPIRAPSFSLDANTGVVIYTPDQSMNGNDLISFVVSDGQLQSNVATVSISINDRPEAVDQIVSVNEDSSGSFALSAVDPDGDTLTYQQLTIPENGTMPWTPPNFTYTPTPNQCYPDNFQYRITDPRGLDDIATVTFDVNCKPIANDDNGITTVEDNPVTVNATFNDSDPDSDPIAVTAIDFVLHGTAAINLDGTITFTPAANYNGPAYVNYTISDNGGATDKAQINITVSPANDSPVALDGTALVQEGGGPITIQLNATDVDGDSLIYSITSGPTHGNASLIGNGPDVSYTPDPTYHGLDSFTFIANDGTIDSNTATVSITVNAPPQAFDNTFTIQEDATTDFDVAGDDTDPDGNSLTIISASNPAHGIGSIVSNKVRYVPNTNYNGADSFTYTISDGNGATSAATVDITINAVNDPPVVSPITNSTIPELQAFSFTASATDPEISSETLTFSLVGSPAGATIDSATGQFNWTPTEAQGPGTYTFQVSATDDGSPALSGQRTVSLTVTEVNRAPNAPTLSAGSPAGSGSNPYTISSTGNTALTFTASATDPDVPANTLTFSLLSQADCGTNAFHCVPSVSNGGNAATITGAGSFSWDPKGPNGAGTQVGTWQFRVVVTDSGGLTSEVLVTITVT